MVVLSAMWLRALMMVYRQAEPLIDQASRCGRQVKQRRGNGSGIYTQNLENHHTSPRRAARIQQIVKDLRAFARLDENLQG